MWEQRVDNQRCLPHHLAINHIRFFGCHTFIGIGRPHTFCHGKYFVQPSRESTPAGNGDGGSGGGDGEDIRKEVYRGTDILSDGCRQR